MHNHRKLQIWEEGIQLSVDVYQLTVSFPVEEKYGLTSQLRRASVSVPSNIAEGAKRNTNKDFARFLSISCGSAAEVETQLELAKRLALVEGHQVDPLIDKCDAIQRKIYNFQLQLLK